MHFLDHFSSHPLKINVRKQTVKENRPKKTVIDLFFKDIFLFSIQDGCKDLIYFDADLDRQDTIFMPTLGLPNCQEEITKVKNHLFPTRPPTLSTHSGRKRGSKIYGKN